MIDVHAHGLTTAFLQAYRGARPDVAPEVSPSGQGAVRLVSPDGSERGPFAEGFLDSAARVRDMDSQGIALQAVSSPPFMFLYEEARDARRRLLRVLNESLVEAASANPARLRVLVSLPLPDIDDVVEEIRQFRDAPTVAGVAIGSSVGGMELDHASLEPMWRELEAADLPVLIHPVDAPGARLGRYFLRNIVGNPVETTVAAGFLIFGGVLERHPSLRVCLVHGGGFLPYQLGRMDHGHSHRSQARRGSSAPPSQFLNQLFFDTILHDPDALAFMASRVGLHRVVIGTDYPFEMGDAHPSATLTHLKLNEEDRRAVAALNAQRLLRGIV